MNIVSLGKIRVMNPGTPVPLSATPLLVAKVRVQAVIGETGRVFLGDRSTFNKATGAGVIKEFWPTGVGGGKADEFEIDATSRGNVIDLSKLYLDANVAGEGAIVTYCQR
jgi:hypothetical protein